MCDRKIEEGREERERRVGGEEEGELGGGGKIKAGAHRIFLHYQN